MQQIPFEPSQSVKNRKIILVLLSGLVFGLILVAFTFLSTFYFRLDLPMYLIYTLLLYLLAPILPSMYIAQQRGDAKEGQQTGLLTGCTGIVLALLVAGIYLWTLTLGSSGYFFISPFSIFFGFFTLNIVGFLVSVPGAIIGGTLGKAWQKRRFVS